MALSSPTRRNNVGSDSIVSTAQQWVQIDYNDSGDMKRKKWSNKVSLESVKQMPGHALCIWFETELGDAAAYSTAPGRNLPTYGRLYLPLEVPLNLEAGDNVDVDLSCHRFGKSWEWTWSLESANYRSEQSSIDSRLLSDAPTFSWVKNSWIYPTE